MRVIVPVEGLNFLWASMNPANTELVVSISVPGQPVELARIAPPGALLGRDAKCDISVNEDWVSPRHLQFLIEGERVLLRDVGSANGTYAEGKTFLGFEHPIQIHEGQRFLVGRHVWLTVQRLPQG